MPEKETTMPPILGICILAVSVVISLRWLTRNSTWTGP